MTEDLGFWLSDSLINRAHSLTTVGLPGFAWSKSDALSVLSELSKSDLIVLGGDVWRLKDNGKIEVTYDNWYVPDGESGPEPLKRALTIERARLFIENYHPSTPNEVLFEFTVITVSNYQKLRSRKEC